MDKLLSNRKHENLSRQVWAMVETQNTSDHHQTMENTHANIYESTETEQRPKMWFHRGRPIQGSQLKIGLV